MDGFMFTQRKSKIKTAFTRRRFFCTPLAPLLYYTALGTPLAHSFTNVPSHAMTVIAGTW